MANIAAQKHSSHWPKLYNLATNPSFAQLSPSLFGMWQYFISFIFETFPGGWVVRKSDFNENPVVSPDLDFDLGFVNTNLFLNNANILPYWLVISSIESDSWKFFWKVILTDRQTDKTYLKTPRRKLNELFSGTIVLTHWLFLLANPLVIVLNSKDDMQVMKLVFNHFQEMNFLQHGMVRTMTCSKMILMTVGRPLMNFSRKTTIDVQVWWNTNLRIKITLMCVVFKKASHIWSFDVEDNVD